MGDGGGGDDRETLEHIDFFSARLVQSLFEHGKGIG